MKFQTQVIRQKQHKLLVRYKSCVMGPIIYLLHFIDTGKYYVGWTPNLGNRIENHFKHPHSKEGKEMITYHEGLKNKCVEVYTLQDFCSDEQAKYWERLWIKKASKTFGSHNLLNIIHNAEKKAA